MCMNALLARMSVQHLWAMPAEARKWHWIPLELELQIATMFVLGIESWSSGRVASALYH